MIIHLEVLDDESSSEIRDLLVWLRDHEDVDGGWLTEVTVPLEEGDMAGGGVLAAIEAAVANQEVLMAVISAAGGWLSARAANRRTRIKIRSGEQEVEIDTAHLDDPDEIARKIHAELRDMA
jgi:hypothetical protein